MTHHDLDHFGEGPGIGPNGLFSHGISDGIGGHGIHGDRAIMSPGVGNRIYFGLHHDDHDEFGGGEQSPAYHPQTPSYDVNSSTPFANPTPSPSQSYRPTPSPQYAGPTPVIITNY